jgi:hypothetical protein
MKKLRQETKEKISKTLKGKEPWNKAYFGPKKFCKICGKVLKNANKKGFCLSHWCQTEEYKQNCIRAGKLGKGKTGGFREGTQTNYKSCVYDGIRFDSSWELIYYQYCKKNKIKIKRNKEGFPYFYNEEWHKFYPDFLLEDGSYVEIKGDFPHPEFESKLAYFPLSIKIIDKESIEKYR